MRDIQIEIENLLQGNIKIFKNKEFEGAKHELEIPNLKMNFEYIKQHLKELNLEQMYSFLKHFSQNNTFIDYECLF